MTEQRPLNILFLGGAKRVSMARMFIEAGRQQGFDVQLYSYELDSHVPVSTVARIVIGKKWSDKTILEDLHRVVEEKEIRIMVPFVDGAVGIVAQYREKYGDIWAPVGRLEIVEAMFDKVRSASIFHDTGLPIPQTYTKGRPNFPLIAKPRFGSASNGIEIVNNPQDFRRIIATPDNYLIQEYIAHRREYTVDCFIDDLGSIICAVPRLRMEVVGGEVSRTVTVDRPDIERLSRTTIDRLFLTGAVTLQFIEDMENRRILLMEINPRLGGGAVCSVHAGANIPWYIIAASRHLPLSPNYDWKPGIEIARYQQEVVFQNPQQ